MRSLLPELRKLRSQGEDACLVSIVNVRGSAPREPGATMLVSTSNGVIGSMGGGQLEYLCSQKAASALLAKPQPGSSSWLRTFPLGSSFGQCCGGVVDVHFEVISASGESWLDCASDHHENRRDFVLVSGSNGTSAVVGELACEGFGVDEKTLESVSIKARKMLKDKTSDCWDGEARTFYRCIVDTDFEVALFGAGHVGSALVAVLGMLECSVRWIDNRRGVIPEYLPDNITAIECASPAREVDAMPAGTSFVVMTHSHPLDFEICEKVLRRQDAIYCGLIGSVSKRRRFEHLMKKQGMHEALLDELTCPIGASGISGKRPAEIAIAVTAELLQIQGLRNTLPVGDTLTPADNVHVI
jgi:xanthine dehydrogenase accessory factor